MNMVGSSVIRLSAGAASGGSSVELRCPGFEHRPPRRRLLELALGIEVGPPAIIQLGRGERILGSELLSAAQALGRQVAPIAEPRQELVE